MLEMIKELLVLHKKQLWLKSINRETDKYLKLKRKADSQFGFLNKLIDKFNEEYGEDLRVRKNNG